MREIQGEADRCRGLPLLFRVLRLLLSQVFIRKERTKYVGVRSCASHMQQHAQTTGRGSKRTENSMHENEQSNTTPTALCGEPNRLANQWETRLFAIRVPPSPRRFETIHTILLCSPLTRCCTAALLDPAGLDDHCWHTGGGSCTLDTAVSVTALSLALLLKGGSTPPPVRSPLHMTHTHVYRT